MLKSSLICFVNLQAIDKTGFVPHKHLEIFGLTLNGFVEKKDVFWLQGIRTGCEEPKKY